MGHGPYGDAPAGHRTLSHTADLALEAWAPTKEECIAQAVHALVESFADTGGAVPDDATTLVIEPSADPDVLVRVLDEVVFQLEVHGRVAVDVSLDERTKTTMGQIEARLAMVPAGRVEVVGPIPKAVSLHDLEFARAGGSWRCHVVVDI